MVGLVSFLGAYLGIDKESWELELEKWGYSELWQARHWKGQLGE